MIIHPQTQSIVLRVRNPELLRQHLPGMTQDIDYEGHNIAVKYDLDVCKVLRNMGFTVPSPIRDLYKWPGKYKPFAHQIETSEFLTFNPKAFVLSDMGTGKTSSILWSYDYLKTIGVVDKLLVIAPLSTLERVWRDEIFSFIMHRSAVVLYGSAERRLELLASDADIYIVNYDGMQIIGKEVRKRKDINLVVVDECAALRTSGTDRYKYISFAVEKKPRLWMASGTPVPNAPTDAWAQVKLISPQNVPMYFSTWQRKTMMKVSMYKWVPMKGSADMVYAAMQPAVRFKKSECLDLPPLLYETREAALTKEQKKAYKEMKATMVAEAQKQQITAVNAADQIGKLRQIACGAIKDGHGKYQILDHKPRLKVLMECVEYAQSKIIVIIPYKGITYALADEINAILKPDGQHMIVVNGDVPPRQRNQLWHDFKHDDKVKGALCHPQVMAHGLTLTEADTLVFYAPISSNELNQQVIERINRPGQTRKMTVIRIGALPLEWSIYHVIETRQLEQQSVLDLYTQEMKR